MKKLPLLEKLIRDYPETPEGKYLVKRRDGSIPEWPHFVLGARDPHAAKALRAYAMSAMKDPNFSQKYIKSILKYADIFDDYRRQYGAGDPHLGIYRTDDPATIAEMRQGQSA